MLLQFNLALYFEFYNRGFCVWNPCRRDFRGFFDLLEEHPDHFFKAILKSGLRFQIEGLLQKLL